MHYFEVILPSLNSPTQNIFTYSSEGKLDLGDLVNVTVRKKSYRGLIVKHVDKPKFATKNAKLLQKNILQEWQLKLYHFINEYYFASPVKTINLFLPNRIFSLKNLDFAPELKQNPFTNTFEQFERAKQKLNEQQQKTLEAIEKHPNKIHLIHGITGSGKTEIYLHLADKMIQNGKQALIMVPEISLTPQTAAYFAKHFGQDQIVVYHSKLNPTEQFHEWLKVKSGQAKVVIGSRSSLFLPFKDLSLIVMDEEHEYAYKQEQIPRYHARGIIQWYHQNLNCTTVLGSATPSLESYYAAKNGKIEYHQITERAKSIPLPQIELIDRKDELRAGNFSDFSDRLQLEIEKHLDQNEQIVILHNKRGYANFLQCLDCGDVLKCPRCSISLTLHKYENNQNLKCHYCNYSSSNNIQCQKCGSNNLKDIGSGIQKVIEELGKLFPSARILRADSDTTSKKHGFDEIYQKFKNHEADILVGTQMIAKGMDIPNVQLVGVINADIGLHLPDFRAPESTFQLLTQVSGRAGRSKKQGHVIIQTYDPMNPVLQAVKHNKTEEFYDTELKVREDFYYPPFAKLTKLTIANKNKVKIQSEVDQIETKLENLSASFKSAPALIEKRHNKFYHNILITTLTPENLLPKLALTPDWKIDRDPVSAV